MQNKKVTPFIIAAFIIGILVVVYIEYNSSKSIDNLISGNEKLLQEFQTNNSLNELEKDIVTIESKVRGAIATNEAVYIEGLNEKFKEVTTEINKLQSTLSQDSSLKDIQQLQTLIQKKIQYNQQLLDSFNLSGKKAAETLIGTLYGKKLTDSIFAITSKIKTERQQQIAETITFIDSNSKKAQRFSSILLAIILAVGVILFWYIINIIRKQITLIKSLNESEKMIKESARIKENFMANMSHEIRTPLNAILGFTYLLQRKSLDTESKDYVETLRRSGENLLTIINDVLDLSKIESGMMRIEEAPFGLRELVHSVEIMFRPKADEKGLSISVTIEESVPDMLTGDATRLTQILINLLGNALKFTEKGGISLQIRTINPAPELKIGITVSDTGIGISKEKQISIFNRFQQADDSITRNYGGTGLGLSIVKELVTLQNGTISVESEPGSGTSFHLMIPYKISKEKNSYSTNDLPITTKQSFLNKSILVAEDNEINQKLIRHLFNLWGLEYDLAQNGAEAVGKVKSGKYSLVLMDIQMPVMDGYTATKVIRNELGYDIPIIAMTAHALAGEREKCIGFGMNDYIPKPLNEAALHNILAKYINTVLPETPTLVANNTKPEHKFRFIDLNYMKEISNGNLEYEKTVTEQFIEAIPEDLANIETAWKENNTAVIKSTAHNMKTTVSVMGLNDRLQVYLDKLEYEDLTEQSFSITYPGLKEICLASVKEATEFLSSLDPGTNT